MSEKKTLLILGVSQAFTAGVLATLLATGSIKTHFGSGVEPQKHMTAGALTAHEASQDVGVTGSLSNTEPMPEVGRSTPSSPEAAPNTSFANLLAQNIDQLKIIPDGIDNAEASALLYAEFSSASAITQGNGSGDLFVLFDPLCPHCHDLYRQFGHGVLQEHDLKAHWIPAVAFLQNPKSMEYSQKLISSVISGNSAVAGRALRDMMMLNDFSTIESTELPITTEGIIRVARNTVGLLQSGTGTPTLLYKNVAGEIEILEGIPNSSDLSDVQKNSPQ